MKRRGSQSGFTLVELTVALVAGLIVAMGIVGLSHEATATFNEEVRNSSAESGLRTAVDRLRSDLQRAGDMSTGNIMSDTMIATPAGQTNVYNIGANMNGLRQLAAIQLTEGGSVTKNPGIGTLSGAQSPALAPDLLLIGGNMTCAEQFDVQAVLPAAGNCQQILLSPVSPAIYRVATAGLANIPAASAELNNAFAPVIGNGATAQFMVRLLDDTGHSQYLATCQQAQVAGITAGGQPFIWVDAINTKVRTSQDTGGIGGVSGYAAGRAWVNPVQVVRWEIASTTEEAANQKQFVNGLGSVVQSAQVDANKYDLIRSYVDALGNPIYQTSEVIAEYAVDFDVAFTVDTTVYMPAGTSTPNLTLTPTMVSYAFDDAADNATWGAPLTAAGPPASPPANQGPQRIRSVRARLVTRTALADRVGTIPVVSQYTQEEFMYRYCMQTGGCTGTNSGNLPWFARARTITTEVSLPNNSASIY